MKPCPHKSHILRGTEVHGGQTTLKASKVDLYEENLFMYPHGAILLLSLDK